MYWALVRNNKLLTPLLILYAYITKASSFYMYALYQFIKAHQHQL